MQKLMLLGVSVLVTADAQTGVGVVHRGKTAGNGGPRGWRRGGAQPDHGGIPRDATLVTGGTIENPRESAPDRRVVTILNGPSTQGSAVSNGSAARSGRATSSSSRRTLRITSARSPRTRLSTWWCE
jgi:hypothetical protein